MSLYGWLIARAFDNVAFVIMVRYFSFFGRYIQQHLSFYLISCRLGVSSHSHSEATPPIGSFRILFLSNSKTQKTAAARRLSQNREIVTHTNHNINNININ